MSSKSDKISNEAEQTNESTAEDWFDILPPREEWVETDYDRVYKTYDYSPVFGGNFVTAGKMAAKVSPDCDVVVSLQRYISTYDLAYVADFNRGLIHIRCYATRTICGEYIQQMGKELKQEYSEFKRGEKNE